jgi:serine/threonine-protein kinase RsbW
MGLTTDHAETAQIVLAEVLNNVVEHAYLYAEGRPIELTIFVQPDGLWCEVTDQGRAMPDGRLPLGRMPKIDTRATGSLPEGGFGWALVRGLTRNIAYARGDGHNHLEFLIPG